jgi:membrane protease YdiL (CAAX protease family)
MNATPDIVESPDNPITPAAGRKATTDVVEAAGKQYSLGKILGLWAVVVLPMPLLVWVVGPALYPRIPILPGLVYWMLIIVGMIWQCVVSLFVLYRELGGLRWEPVRKRLWLNLPRDPKTGEGRARLFWWVIPCLLFSGLISLGIGGFLDAPLTALIPALKEPAFANMSSLANPQLKGQWWIMGVALVSFVLNYFLGEELFFRGILLPKMNGVFGRWDWVANAVLFGMYHMHKPWVIPSLIVGALAITWPARRFRSIWMAVIVHGVEGFFLITVLLVILGRIP